MNSAKLEKIYESFKTLTDYRYRKDSFKNEEAHEALVATRVRLINRYPFFGVTALSLIFVETDAISTLAVDGFHMFYNPNFVLKLRPGERDFGIAHEVLHCALKHCGVERMGPRNPKMWNWAVDFVTNAYLVKGKVGEMITTVKILHDTMFDGWSAEDVYDYLEKNPKERPNGGLLDEHILVGIGGGGDSSGEGVKFDGKTLSIPKEIYDKLAKDFADVIAQARAAQYEAEIRQKTAGGTLPDGMWAEIDELMQPKVNWRDVLRHYTAQVIKRGYSYAKPNKALFSAGWTIPGYRQWQREVDLVVAIDTSGSVTDEQRRVFFSELHGIITAFHSFRVHMWCFGGVVHEASVVEITRDNEEEFFTYKPVIGGGTVFEANWEYMIERGIKPKLLIVFTDGYPNGDWGIPDYCPTMFVIVGTRDVVPPFGVVAYYDDYQEPNCSLISFAIAPL